MEKEILLPNLSESQILIKIVLEGFFVSTKQSNFLVLIH